MESGICRMIPCLLSFRVINHLSESVKIVLCWMKRKAMASDGFNA